MDISPEQRARLRAAAEQATPGMMVVEAAAVLRILDALDALDAAEAERDRAQEELDALYSALRAAQDAGMELGGAVGDALYHRGIFGL